MQRLIYRLQGPDVDEFEGVEATTRIELVYTVLQTVA